MTVLVVGGDSAAVFRRRAAGRHGRVEHWTGRKTRDLAKSIPKATDAVVVVLDRVSHALANKVRAEASRRGLPVYFRKRGRRVGPDMPHASDALDLLFSDRDAS